MASNEIGRDTVLTSTRQRLPISNSVFIGAEVSKSLSPRGCLNTHVYDPLRHVVPCGQLLRRKQQLRDGGLHVCLELNLDANRK